jgi:hypothetical protein
MQNTTVKLIFSYANIGRKSPVNEEFSIKVKVDLQAYLFV